MSEVKERLFPGTYVHVVKGEHAGRIGVITDVNFDNPNQAALSRSGDPTVNRTAEPSSYTVRTRDADRLIFGVDPDEVSVTDATNFGRITPPDVAAEQAQKAQEHIDERRARSADRQPEQAEHEEVEVTDAAATAADERGVDLEQVEGSGVGGRITKSDVEATAQEEG